MLQSIVRILGENMKKILIFMTCLTVWSQLSLASFASTPVGVIEKANGSGNANGPQGKRNLTTGSTVFKDDTIKTGFWGRLQLRFIDQTKLVIGPRSEIKIDEFIPDNDRGVSSFAIRAARGTFRFISGISKKSAYKISTRNAVMGIRGTGFDFSDRNGTSIVLYNGLLTVCVQNTCIDLNSKCEMALQRGGRLIRSTTAQLPPNAYSLTFPFIRSESGLLAEYRLGAAACDSGVGKGPKGGNSEGGTGGTGGGKR